MALNVLFHNAVPDYDAQDMRNVSTIFAGATTSPLKSRSGIKETNRGDFEVTVAGSTATVKPGMAFIEGSTSLQGGYVIYNTSSTPTYAIAASHATLSRYDLLYLAVQDSDLGQGAGKTAVIAIAQGTPAASPTEPTGLVPVNAIVLARLEVPPASGTILVQDRRPWLAALGGITKYESGFQSSVPDGELYYLRGTGKLIYNHAGTNQTIHDPTLTWVNLSPAAGFETNASQTPQILRDGHMRYLRGRIQRTGAATIVGNTTYLMKTLDAGDRPPSGKILWFPAITSLGTTQFAGRVEVNGTDGGLRLIIPTNNSSSFVDISSVSWSVLA